MQGASGALLVDQQDSWTPFMTSLSSSRIFVKNLPSSLSAEEFRKYFSQISLPTDSKLLSRRRIGYVGFKTPEDAQRAVKYYNKTFIGLARLKVDLAEAIGGPVAKRRRLSSSDDKTHEGSQDSDAVGGTVTFKGKSASYEDDHTSIRVPSKRTWQNQDDSPHETKMMRSESRQISSNEASSPGRHLKKPQSPPLQVVESTNADLPSPPKTPIPCDRDQGNERFQDRDTPQDIVSGNNGEASDKDWLRSRTSRLLGLVDEDDAIEERFPERGKQATIRGRSQEPLTATYSDVQTQPESDKIARLGSSSNLPDLSESSPLRTSARLFVRNITYTATEQDLRTFFEEGCQSTPTAVHLPLDVRSGHNKGFAHITFEDAATATRVLHDVDQQTFQGRLVHIMADNGKLQDPTDRGSYDALPLKKRQDLRRKKEASTNTFNWNSLFMSADAVLSSLADRLGVPKTELLDPASSDAAVKQAQAETHVIQESKAYFLSQGVNLEAFKGKNRGKLALLIKNFPYGTRQEDLRSLFEPFGRIAKLIMPPAGTIAIVQFISPGDANAAFAGLAYRRFRDSVLYLEKAPDDLFTSEGTTDIAKEEGSAKPTTTELLDETNTDSSDTATVFIKNLNFSTTSQVLHDTFASLGGFRSARVKTRTESKRPGEVLSMGFGFLEFETKEEADSAIAVISGYRLEGHELVARASHRGIDAAQERRKADAVGRARSASTKIIIKNIPFEASKKDIRTLFGTYGKLRSVRLPKNYDNSTRGFAFADFFSAREAANAVEALRNSHLLGRRLVLEAAAADSADPEAEIEKMQEKASRQCDKVALQKLVAGSARKKFTVEGVEDLNQGL